MRTPAWEIQERGHQLRETKEGRGELPRNFPSSHLSWSDVEAQFERFGQRLDLRVSSEVVSPLDGAGAKGDEQDGQGIALPFLGAGNYYGNLERFVEDVWELTEEDSATVIAVSSHSRRLSEIFGGEGVDVTLAERLDGIPDAGSITLMQSAAGGLSDGFVLPFDGKTGKGVWSFSAMWRFSGWRSRDARGGDRCVPRGMPSCLSFHLATM